MVGYSGNLGRPHEVDTLIEAIANLEQDCNEISARRENGRKCDVVWLFVGGGALYRKRDADPTFSAASRAGMMRGNEHRSI